jgi:hypothetical protein
MHVHIQGEHSSITFFFCNQFALVFHVFHKTLGLNVNCKPCFTIKPIETKLFVMVGTWSTSFKYYVCMSCIDNGTLPICVMECVVSTLVSKNLSVFKSLVSLNHPPWLIM